MSYANDNLGFMLWQMAEGISYKEQQCRLKRRKQIRRNETAEIGSKVRCAICGKKFKKLYNNQAVCSKNRCNNRYRELI